MKNKTAENMSLYERAIKALPADHIDHHESDLYLKATPEAEAIINEWLADNGFKSLKDSTLFVNRFRCNISGCMWFDIAFQYIPYIAQHITSEV